MEKIALTGKETKAHVQEALNAVFPNVKFSLTSSSDSVLVSWTDGPIPSSVEEVLSRFESYTRSPDLEGEGEASGYEWKGQRYIGARYLSTYRELTSKPSNVVPLFQKDSDLPYQAPEQMMKVAILLWKIIELGDILEHPVPLEQLERVMKEMEQIRAELERLNGSFRIVNSDLLRLSEKLDKLILRQRAGPEAP